MNSYNVIDINNLKIRKYFITNCFLLNKFSGSGHSRKDYKRLKSLFVPYLKDILKYFKHININKILLGFNLVKWLKLSDVLGTTYVPPDGGFY